MPQSSKRKGRKAAKSKPRTPKEDAAQQAAQAIKGGVLVTIVELPGDQQGFDVKPVEGSTLREAPTILRQAAAFAEKRLIEAGS
jgi:hypothetical protein